MKQYLLTMLVACFVCQIVNGQVAMSQVLSHTKDSTLKALYYEDSLKVEKEFAGKAKWENVFAKLQFPSIKGGQYSGIIPIKDPTEVPDPNLKYKILFELITNNPDSTSKEINAGLNEIARVINLHTASGIPAKNIMPVIVVHGPALQALKNNEAYQKKYKIENPNINLINDLSKYGAKFIACGQAMTFFDVTKEELLPVVKVSLTAKTVITGYQLQGYVLMQAE